MTATISDRLRATRNRKGARRAVGRLVAAARTLRRGPHPLAAFRKPAEQGVVSGVWYVELLAALHAALQPTTYFEIGTSTGASLSVARCRSVCVDPQFFLSEGLVEQPRELFPMTSDAFFAQANLASVFPRGIDLAFLDGMHLYEYVYRDLMHTERYCHARSVVVLHDCLPLNTRMAERKFRAGEESEYTRGYWTGDVWKMIPTLKKYRPDLDVAFVDCPPTGLVVISGLDPACQILARNYDRAMAEFVDLELGAYGLPRLYDTFPLLESRRLTQVPDTLARLAPARG